MGRFLDSVFKRPSRSYAAEASYPWDPATSKYADPSRLPYAPPFPQAGSDLGVGPSRRRPSSPHDSLRSEPTGHSHSHYPSQQDFSHAHPRHSFTHTRRRGPSPVPEEIHEPRRNSFSAKSSKGALFDGDLPPLPPIPSQHEQHIHFQPENRERDSPGPAHADHIEHDRTPLQRRDTRSKSHRPESGHTHPNQQFAQLTGSPHSHPPHTPPTAATGPKEAQHRLSKGATSPPQLRSPPLAPAEKRRSASGSRVALSSPHSPPVLARTSDRRHIPSLTLAIAPPSSLTPSPPRLLSPASNSPEAHEPRSGPTSPRVVQFADVVEYSEPPDAYSDEESEYSQHSDDAAPVSAPLPQPGTPATPKPRPTIQIKDDALPPVPPRSPKRGAPGARRDSMDSSASPTSPTAVRVGDATRTAPPAPLVPPKARAQTSTKGSGDSSAARSVADTTHAAERDQLDAVSEEVRPPPRASTPEERAYPSAPHGPSLPTEARPQQLASASHVLTPTPEVPTAEVFPSSTGSDDNSVSSAPSTLLASPLSPNTPKAPLPESVSGPVSGPPAPPPEPSKRASVVLDEPPRRASLIDPPSKRSSLGADEPPSRRASLVLDDAASEKSVYYTPRNSFYFNGNGSKASLHLEQVGRLLRATDDQGVNGGDVPEPLILEGDDDMPGAFPTEHVSPLAAALAYTPTEEPVLPSAPAPVGPDAAHAQVAGEPPVPAPVPAPATNDAPDDQQHGSDDHGSFETAEGPMVEQPPLAADPVQMEVAAPAPQLAEEMETPHVKFSELPTFHLQPPTPATVTDVMDSPFRDLDSPPLQRNLALLEEDEEPDEGEMLVAAPRSTQTSASSYYLDDDVDLDSFAPDEIAYYNPDGPADEEVEAEVEVVDRRRKHVSMPAGATAPAAAQPANRPRQWYQPHEKTKPRSRTTSLSRRETSGSSSDRPPPLPPKSKRDRGGRVSGAVVQVLNRPSTPGASTAAEKSSRTRAAAMVDNYTSSLQRSKSNRSVRSTRSTRTERSGTVSSQRTIVPDKPERRAEPPRAPTPTTPKALPPRSQTPRMETPRAPRRPVSPAPAPPAPQFPAERRLSSNYDEPQFHTLRRSSSTYDAEPQHLNPPATVRRSSSVYGSPRHSLVLDEWNGNGGPHGTHTSGSGTSSELSAPSSRPLGPLNRAVIGQGGWAAAAAEPVKMFVPSDGGDGWAAFQPIPPRSRATPLPGSRTSSFDLGGPSSSSAASSSIAQSASGSVAGSSHSPGQRVLSPSLTPIRGTASPPSSVSGRPPSRLRASYHAEDAYSSDEGERPSRSYASPQPDHPANLEPTRESPEEYGMHTPRGGGREYTEHYDYGSGRSSHTSPPAIKGSHRWHADVIYERNERSMSPSRAPSSRSSVYSAPSMYSATSTPIARLNSPLPPLPPDSSPYEAAARAHAARLGLASGLTPNVLTVLPEMSIQDSNELYLPQRRNSRKFGSSSSELGARGNMSPRRSASLFNVKRYSRASSDIGHSPREYALSEFGRRPAGFDRRHSFDPRRGSFDARTEGRAPSRSQSFRAPSRTGDYNPGDIIAASHGTGVISLDTPDIRPLNNYPLMESDGYDQTQGNGYTNMVLPKGGGFKPVDPTKSNGPDLQLLGVPPTSMAAITLSSALHTYHLKYESPTPAHLRWTLPPPVDFSTVPPPHRVGDAQVLVQVYAVAVDWLDIAALDNKGRNDVGRWIPGRSFVGRCITTGGDEKEILRGDVVIGLLDIRHSGALAEYIVADRRRVARVDPDTHLELEELAALPAQGIAVHRAIRGVGVSRGQQALVMDAHEGLPALFCQELTRMGLVVTAIVPGASDGAHAAALAYGARGVLTGSPISVMHSLPESLFALVIDTAGAADAARRILSDRGHVLSLRTGDISQKHTLKSKLGFGKRKILTAAYVQPAGAGDPPVDASGLDYRDVLEEPVLGVLHPAVHEVVAFEQGMSVFASRRNMDRLRVAVVRIVN